MFNLNWCRNLCHEGNDDGTISGKNKKLSVDNAVPLTTFFYNALYKKKTIDPSKLAVSCYDRVLTFSELDCFSSALAIELKDRLGNQLVLSNPDEELIIAICLPPSEKLITVIFSILKVGAAYLPLDPCYPEDILITILEKFRPLMLLTNENGPIFTKYDTNLFSEQCKLLSLEDVWLGMNLSTMSTRKLMEAANVIVEPLIAPNSTISPIQRPAAIFQTIELSSDPRGVRISHQSIMNQIFWSWRELPFHKEGACCLTSPASLVWSLNQIFAPLLKGVTLHILSRKDTKEMDTFIRKIGQTKITRIYLIPVVLRDFLNECWSIGKTEVNKLLHILINIICEGDTMSKNLAKLFFTVFPNNKTLTNIYGCTELSGNFIGETYKNEKDVDLKCFQRRLTFGKCVDNTRIQILGIGNTLVNEWSQGEICVSGSQVALGFVNMKCYPIEHGFVTNPNKEDENHSILYRTGLFGRMVRCSDERLRLYIEGRGDDVIVHQGYEISMEDIRVIIGKIPTVRFMEALVFHPGKLDQALVAFIVPQHLEMVNVPAHSPIPSQINSQIMITEPSKEELTVAGLDYDLRTKLPEFMIPEIKVLINLPFIQNTQKVDQTELLYSYQLDREPNLEVWTNLKLQNTEMYEAAKILFTGMYKFCSTEVKTCIANMDLSCFDLGATSLNIVCLSSYICSKDYEIHLREMLVITMSMHDLIHMMVKRKIVEGKRRKSSNLAILTFEVKEEFTVRLLDSSRSKEAFKLVANAYTEKGELEAYNLVRPQEYHDFLTYYFNAYKEQSICFYVTQKPYDEISAVCIAHDYFTDFNIKMDASLMFIIEIQQEIKGVNLGRLPHKRNKILELFIMATHERMSSAQNVQLVLLMLGELTNFAEKENYTHIFVNSANQLIRNLCSNVLGYTIINDFPIRDFIQKDGFRPYRLAPSIICMTSLCCRLPNEDGGGDGEDYDSRKDKGEPA